jgi:predicted ATPase/class 3 adenylate cyclase
MTTRSWVDLPTGQVTFLFTDIEGSTELLHRLDDRYPALLETHASILRRAIAEHSGVEVSTEGDSFFAVFAVATEAVTAATSAQRALAAAAWPDGIEVRVRMGIHTGEGKRGGDNYAGLDVNRAARIAAAAHGGQVVLSDEARAIAARGLPDGATLRDLGDHRLKGLERRERLYQLDIAGLPTTFPPLRALESRRSNLPEPLTSLVGREEQVSAVVELLGEYRVVTLTGPGGTGKTRLSIAAGNRMLDRSADGVFFVALDVVPDAGLVPSLIAHALGVRETAQQSPLEAAKRYLAERDVLLVLDNFEHVVDAALVVDELLAEAPRLRVLATSRVPLRLYGERLYSVPPMTVPDPGHLPPPEQLASLESVRLFLDRARAVRPDFEITADNAAAIASICLRLDGLPLAIELAAARINVFGPEAILGLLDRGLGVLSTGTRNRTGRQQSLRGAVAWSVDLLAPAERALFQRLAVFYGGFTLVEAEEVAAGDAGSATGLVDDISALVDASLLRAIRDATGSPRFGMLQTIHEYALETLVASGEHEAVARGHALHFMAGAEEAALHLNRPDQATWFDQLGRSIDNLRAALRWAASAGDVEIGLRTATAIWRFWQRTGQLREGRETLERFLAARDSAANPIRPAVLAAALSAAGSLAYWQADLGTAEALYREALELDRAAGDRARIGDDYYNLGFVAMASRDFASAREAFGLSAAGFRAVDDRARLAEVSGPLGVVELQTGNIDDALTWLEQARDINREIGDRARLADNTMVLGIIHRRRNEPTTAAAYAREAVTMIREIGDQARLPLAIESVAAVAFAEGQLRRGVILAGAARHMRQTLGGVVPSFWDSIDEPLARANVSLGADAYAAALAEGEAMDLDRAVEFAVG